MLPLMEMVCYRFRQPKQVTQENMQPLWATAYGNGMLPLMEMVGNLSKLPKKVCNRFGQPLMETVLVLPKSLEPLHLFSRKGSQYQ